MDGGTRTMDQKIFSMDLPVEAVSLYLLCCGLVDAGATVSTKHLLSTWNGTPEELEQSLKTLEDRGILQKILEDAGNAAYRVRKAQNWK